MLKVVSPNTPWVALGHRGKVQVFDHLERQIVFLLIGGVDSPSAVAADYLLRRDL